MALEYIHSFGIIHRDLKPENIVFEEKGYVRITDFGIAKIMNEEEESCKTTEPSGTPGYMAPEVIQSRNHSFPVDYFALGIIAYECMQGRVLVELFRGPNIFAYEIPKFDGNSFKPSLYFGLNHKIVQKKVDHLMTHYKSQQKKIWYRPSTFEATMSLRGVESGKYFAEGFEVIKYILGEHQ